MQVFQGDRQQFTCQPEIARRPRPEPGFSGSGGMRQLAVGARAVHRPRKLLGQHLGQLVDRNVEPGGELLDRVAAQHLLQLVGRDRQVLAGADPGFDLVAEPGLFELGDDGRQAALPAIALHLAEHDGNHGRPELAKHALQLRRILQGIENAHGLSPFTTCKTGVSDSTPSAPRRQAAIFVAAVTIRQRGTSQASSNRSIRSVSAR
ncbi:hypothetical protein SB7C_12355, partial [Staphylococcus epidermidis]